MNKITRSVETLGDLRRFFQSFVDELPFDEPVTFEIVIDCMEGSASIRDVLNAIYRTMKLLPEK